jgi:type I restriction enzyme S subunit
MITNLPRYPAYRNSGVPWLGQVPIEWEVRRQRNAADILVSNVDKISAEGEFPVRLCNYVDVYKNERITASLSFMRATATKGEIARFHLQPRDVLITKDSESWTDIGVPALVEFTAPDLVCGYHLAILRPEERVLDGRFLLRALQSQGVAAQLHASANGVTRYGLSHDAIKSVQLPIPPLLEQALIVRFLDHVDRRIRRHITDKKKLIALLNEQRQVIIHRAVTGGLQDDVPLKPSGVGWLGDVPANWELTRVKHATNILRGRFTHRPRNDPSYYDGPYPFIQTGEVARAARSITSFRQTLNERGLAVSKMFPSGTLVMSIAANIGDVAVLDFDACFPDSIVGFVPRPGVDRDFLYYVFVAMKAELFLEAPVNTQGNLSTDRIGARAMALPPFPEQREIVRSLDVWTANTEKLVTSAQDEVALMRLYRTRLINDVVTGKLDVRVAAARLPDQVENSELLDDMDALAQGDESEVDLDAALEQGVA